MAQYDKLDKVLNDSKMTNEDWFNLAKILEINEENVPALQSAKRKLFNKELRHSYGHAAVNIFRNEFEPDYREIVCGTAEKLGIDKEIALSKSSIEEIEDKIIIEVLSNLKQQIIKEQGAVAWQKIEDAVEGEIQKLIAEGKCPKDATDVLLKMSGPALFAAIFAGRMAGFGLYIAVNQLVFAIARQVGINVGVAVAGPIVGRVLAGFLGPAGWLASAAWLFYTVGDTNWKRVIPAIFMVASLRKRFLYEF